jgi:hypothetical protein
MSINTTSATRQRLDFEDDEAREERLGRPALLASRQGIDG